ncbi:MAG: histidine--tRNA ligase [Candidatus Methylacidiphilales bacterium]|nr:histidine--tRNA ligase [Candidatus Methylacidiphilales bacterium]
MPVLPGFRDFYPEECAGRNAIFSTWRSVATRYGFVEYDGPPLEELELYTKKSGDEIAGQLYHFTDRGERAVALRPELTPTLARMVAARHRDYKKPLKWFAIPQVFRYERMQRGRLREHYQLNCDLLGEPSLEADVEIISLCIDVLRAFGLTSEDFVIRLSDRQFWTDFLKQRNVPEPEWYAVFQAIDKSEREPRDVTRQKLGALADDVINVLENGAQSERLDTVERSLALRGFKDYVKRDFTIVRGLAYYTGIVWEAFDRSGVFRAIGGGGRYDSLLENLGGVAMPALGFGMGDVVLGELLKEKGKAPSTRPVIDYYVAIADESVRDLAMELVQKLRNAGLRTDFTMATGVKLGKQLEQASARGACNAIVADAKLKSGEAELKDLQTREQRTVPVTSLFPAA